MRTSFLKISSNGNKIFLKISSNGNKILKSKLMTTPSYVIIFNFPLPFSIDAVNEAIARAWPRGKSYMQTRNVQNEELTEIKLNGNPWFSSGDESVAARKLLAEIIQNLSKIGWKFLAGVNIKGGTDSLFFIQISHQVSNQTVTIL